ncbi:MAG: hypothetical protein H8E36_11435 [Rhodospirillaceae bacterium]|nr:hypothetical protein [Rhodospirillaceae bacterium]
MKTSILFVNSENYVAIDLLYVQSAAVDYLLAGRIQETKCHAHAEPHTQCVVVVVKDGLLSEKALTVDLWAVHAIQIVGEQVGVDLKGNTPWVKII